MSKLPEDALNRQRALDPQQSFIVQAPAGSGKTSLLTQRFLRLLTTVNNPEEILAITFTRKAAAEMHLRVIEALMLAQHPEPSEDYLKQMWQLATRALAHDAEKNWQLLHNPNRLRIKTIDSLCAYLTKQMPVLARFGSQPSIEADCRPLYALAARGVLEEIENDGVEADAVRLLVSHLDNKLARAEDLIAGMLAKRDQWLRHVMAGLTDKRDALEYVLQGSIEDGLEKASQALPSDEKETLCTLLAFAATNLDSSDPVHVFGQTIDLHDYDASNLESWQMVADFLLTGGGDYRKQAAATLGFPAPSKTKDKGLKETYKNQKSDYKALLTELNENPNLLAALRLIRALPAPNYSENQWAFIDALLTVLPLAVAHLRLVFQQQGCVDFCEVSLSASRALHDATGATELGLKLDYQLRHLLVDEFQDTSETQYELLKDLVSGWQPDDGRTLFLVGDPMQSIYRFRQAEVGLFLKTQQQGLGEVDNIEPLMISVNFRSQAGIVDWVNTVFSEVMPQQDDIFSSAISYKSSIASKAKLAGQAVHSHAHISRELEGENICQLIQAIQQNNPDDTIAVLVRGRRALQYLVPELNAAGLAFQATDIDPLASRQGVIDLLSLTRACLQPADKIAWLAILRAPWCGLTLEDLYCLVDGTDDVAILDVLNDEQRLATLSEEGRIRVAHFMQHMQCALNNRERVSLTLLVKGLWADLLGPKCLQSEAELNDAYRYFDCLAKLESATDNVDIKTLSQHVENLYSAVDVNASDKLQIMTAHKSKGLQFDHVILLGLDRSSGKDDSALLTWLERPSAYGDTAELLVAPLKETGSKEEDSISQYLSYIGKQKATHENQRLLYVAATRAKKNLHLSFKVSFDNKTAEIKTPAKNTLLGLLWPAIKDTVACESDGDKVIEVDAVTSYKLSKINVNNYVASVGNDADWLLQSGTESPEEIAPKTFINNDVIEFDWATALASSIGTVCHQLMQLMGLSGVTDEAVFVEKYPPKMIQNLLLETGVLPHEVENAAQRVEEIMRLCLQDTRGRWVLDNSHASSEFEYPLSGVINGEVVRSRLDRTFVSDGVCWIIDYKTGRHDDTDKDQFLDAEMQRYKSQLNKYARLMRGLDEQPIKLGLYYPAIQGWRSWGYDG